MTESTKNAGSSEPKAHPWNSGFSWQDHTGPFRGLTDAQAKSYDEQGFVVIPDLLTKEQLEAARAECNRFDDETEQRLEGGRDPIIVISEAGALTFTLSLAAQSEVLRAIVTCPRIVDITADLLGPNVRLYWDASVYKKPEKPRHFPWHQDNGYKFVEPQQYLTFWIALEDATVENGCLQVVPELHRQGTLEHTFVYPLGWECLQNPEKIVPAPVKAGGAVLISSLTPHLTGPNVSQGVRRSYIVQYAIDGTVRLAGDPSSGSPEQRLPQNDPDRQFPVLVDGQPVKGPTK